MSPRTAELAVADGDRARLQQLGYKQGWLVVAAFNGCVALSMAGRSARPTRPPAASTTGAPSSPARTGRPSLPGSPDGNTRFLEPFGNYETFSFCLCYFSIIVKTKRRFEMILCQVLVTIFNPVSCLTGSTSWARYALSLHRILHQIRP